MGSMVRQSRPSANPIAARAAIGGAAPAIMKISGEAWKTRLAAQTTTTAMISAQIMPLKPPARTKVTDAATQIRLSAT